LATVSWPSNLLGGRKRMLEVKGLEGGYGDFKILQGVNLKVEKSTITCLLGPNGSGKTTTLNTIVGLLKPWRGTIKFEDIDITGIETHKIVEMGISLVPEGRRIFGEMSVIENLQMGAYLKSARDKMRDRLEYVFSIFPRLKERQGQKACTLSGGEQSMLAIARALICNPKLLMLDEPSFGLAPKLSIEILSILKRLRDEEGITILLVEQNIHLAGMIMDYGYLLLQGVTIAEGTFNDLINDSRVKKAYLG